MHPTRAIHRSPSSTTASRAWAAAQIAEDNLKADPEAALARAESPKKAAPPSFRRKKPLALMCVVLFVTVLLGSALFLSQQDTASGDAGSVTATAAAGGPSIAPQEAWNPLHLRTKVGYDTIPGSAYVEFTAPGLFLPLKDALDIQLTIQPEELQLQESPTTTLLDPQHRQGGADANDNKIQKNTIDGSLRESFNSIWSGDSLLNSTKSQLDVGEGRRRGQRRHLSQIFKQQEVGKEDHTAQQQQQHSTLHAAFPNGVGTPETWPQPEGIRLLVAVTSACCTQVSLQRRAAIRRTWAALIKERYGSGTTSGTSSGSISIQFFLAQPENDTVRTEWLPALEEEIIAHNDTVVLRGKDAYLNLPNKTFRMLRYALAHPSEYTHVLKADDDTWVRMHKVLDYLHEKTPAQGGGLGNTTAAAAAATPTAAATAAIAAIQRKAELEKMSRDRGVPIVSEGMTLYDASSLVQRVDQGQTDASYAVDDVDGSRLTLEELARRSNWYANRARDSMFEKEIKREDSGENDSQKFGGEEEAQGGVEEGKQTEENDGSDAGQNTGRKRKRELLQQQQQKESELLANALNQGPFSRRPRLSGVYLGCIENQKGFQPIRDKNNKWYVSEKDLPETSYPHGVKYLAGWGYILSRDLIMHVVQKVNSYESQPEYAPVWYNRIAFEDVLVGLLLHDVVPMPESQLGFRPAWRACVPDTAVRHLDIDSPRLLTALVEQDISGLSDEKPVQCSSGQFLPGDYSGWYAWRNGLEV